MVNPLLESDDISLRRVFLYKPSVALIVLDIAEVGGQREQFRRWFHIGPGIGVTRRPAGAMRLATPASREGSSTGTQTGSRKTFTASEPFQGYNFPRFREAVPRTTIMLQSERTRS